MTYVPDKLLKQCPENMEMEEFLEALAMARYVEELKQNNFTAAIVAAFED